MLFNSLVFLLFAALFYGLWPLMRQRQNLRWIYIVVSSFFFYGWWDWRFLFLLTATGLVDFFGGLAIERYPKYGRTFLTASLTVNLGTLVFFKYFTFIVANLNVVLDAIGSPYQLPRIALTLPVGISFYTFQAMSYTIDIYRGHLRPTRNVFHYFAFLSLFPQLVAGPIERARHLLPQLTQYHKTTEPQRWEGLTLIVHGYFKKVVIADNLAPVVNAAFGAGMPNESSLYWWIVVTMFAFQIYCDFSGYSDIARGLAKWMGYELQLNFNHPYIASSLQEFWSRWHISLSTWFRDYVYFPLGGNQRSKTRRYFSLVITMLLSGLWHGAAWTFVIWGGLHALFLTAERMMRWPKRIGYLTGGRLLAWLGTILQVWVAWVFFRAESLEQAVQVLTIMFGLESRGGPVWGSLAEAIPRASLIFLLIAIVGELYFYLGLNRRTLLVSEPVHAVQPLVLALMIVACIYLRGPGSAFIYFQF